MAANRDDSAAERELLDEALRVLHAFTPTQKITTNADDDDDDNNNLGATIAGLRTLGFELFFPWLDPVKEANKVYFAKQEGAVEKLLSIVDTCKHNTILCYYAVGCIWNFASTDEMSRIVLELGSLEIMFPLVRSADQDLVSASIGCLWGYLEFEDVQEHVVKMGLSDTLVDLAGHLDQVSESEHTCLIGCLLCLASNPRCRRHLVERDATQSVIAAASSTQDNMLRYVSVVCMALLTLDSESEDRLLAMGVLTHVSSFLEDLQPHEIAELDKEQGMVWKFIQPFFSLMSSRHAPIRQMSGFILATLSQTAVHRPLFKSEELLGDVLAIRMTTGDARLRAYLDTALSFLGPLGMDAPSLLALCAYGHRSRLELAPQPPAVAQTVALLPQHLHDRFLFTSPI